MPGRALDKKPKVLYIEDNRENRMLVRAVLEAAGYTIVEAEDGLAGIEAAIREEPALILLDINLPGVDGYEIVDARQVDIEEDARRLLTDRRLDAREAAIREEPALILLDINLPGVDGYEIEED